MAKFTIEVMSPEKFENLPYRYAKDSFGLCDRKNGKIFLMDLGDGRLNRLTLDHEMDEMIAKYSNHEDEDGIRYKHKKTWRNATIGILTAALGGGLMAGGGAAAAPAATGTGTTTAATGTTLYGGAAPATGYTAGGIGAGGNMATAGQMFAAPTLTAGGAAVGAAGAGSLAGSAGAGLTAGKTAATGTGLTAAAAGKTATAGKTAGALDAFSIPKTTTPAVPKSTGSIGAQGIAKPATTGNVSRLYGGPAPSVAKAGLPSAGQTSSAASQGGIMTKLLGKSWPKTLAGFAIPMAAQGMKQPEMPESAEVASLSEKIKGGDGAVTPIGTLGLEKLTGRLGAEYSGLPEDYKTAQLANFDNAYKDAKDSLVSRYKQLRPGADIETDSAFRKDMMKLESDWAQKKSNYIANLEHQHQQEFLTREAEDMRTALGVDEQTFNRYADIAQLDLDRIMLEYGIDYATAAQFKEIFGKFGGMMMQKGLGLDKVSYT